MLAGRAVCSCPLCGVPVPVSFERADVELSRRFEARAHSAVLDHLMTDHAPVIEHSTVVAIGALILAGAGALRSA